MGHQPQRRAQQRLHPLGDVVVFQVGVPGQRADPDAVVAGTTRRPARAPG